MSRYPMRRREFHGGTAMTSSKAFFALASILSIFFPFHGVTTEINISGLQSQQNCSSSDVPLECEIQEMNYKIAHLEFLVEKIDRELNSKSLYIEKCEKKIEELSLTIQHLESLLSNLKDAPDYEKMIKLFEEQVRELEVVVKKNDLNLWQLEVKAKDDEKSVKMLASQVDTMVKIVPELWFHVQKLEQAREVIERRTVELRRQLRSQRCSFFKYINNFPARYNLKKVVTLSEAINWLKRSFSTVKKYHHQVSLSSSDVLSSLSLSQSLWLLFFWELVAEMSASAQA
ncbi:uncharacterized protein LOC130815944 isoform X2 [Amaranthus tricolor]|uniref:uncharacterized protein LOC130815944 isoform X2 n=1 Tax=Amaranthus tricolor TaxID=29722 RepID=UPI0025892D16|nr:uncharacterized protein LOC130815944 isoform X2 [Amaranthus tricolor]